MLKNLTVGDTFPDYELPDENGVIHRLSELQGGNPLAGPNDESFGPRFPPMDGAYDAEHLATLRRVAQALGLRVREGVYLATLGPNFESHAEVRAFGLQPTFSVSSTDSNIPMSMGIPALTIGRGGPGGRSHSPDEWTDG